MAVKYTSQQQRVIDARGHNILVSAAAGSGKTAVLVERIIRLVTDEQHPIDIDRLLVVTFTRAAAAQMRERIAAAIRKRLTEEPGNRHLQRQETLLHNAQITTIDSFCTFLLHNNFGDIDLDPGFRQMDEMEAKLLGEDALTAMLEQQYQAGGEDFDWCMQYFCPGVGDGELRDRIRELYRRAMSHPWPKAWLAERAEDYAVKDTEDLFAKPWFADCLEDLRSEILDAAEEYDGLIRLCGESGGPYPYKDLLEEERRTLLRIAGEDAEGSHSGAERRAPEQGTEDDAGTAAGRGTTEINIGSSSARVKKLWNRMQSLVSMEWKRLPAIRKSMEDIDPSLKGAVSETRAAIKKKLQAEAVRFFADSPETTVEKMHAAERPLRELLRLTSCYMDVYAEAKQEKNVIDFDDLEHFALNILCERREDGTVLDRPAAAAYRAHFAEILCDEYQDSNDVQELLLSMISGESEGRRNRFMVGDVKQSIYKFRLARPEIFMEKYRTCRPGDDRNERIDLDRNFRSRAEVLEPVNDIFRAICRPEVGGVDYDSAAELKPGNLSYPPYPDAGVEFLVVNQDPKEEGYRDAADPGAGGSEAGQGTAGPQSGGSVAGSGQSDSGDPESAAPGTETNVADESPDAKNARQKEALAIAQRIRELIREYRVTDDKTGELRPVRYGDIVILLRATAGWDADFRYVFEQQGIPCYVAAKAGYFQTEEIREIVQVLRVLDNPRQDIPLYGAMRGYFGGFDEEELALIRAEHREKGTEFYTAVCRYAGVPVILPEGGDTSTKDADTASKEPSSDEPVDEEHRSAEGGKGSGISEGQPVTGQDQEAAGAAGGPDSALAAKCRRFLDWVTGYRKLRTCLPIHELLLRLVTETGYEDYITALPSGGQRDANLRMLLEIARNFEKTAYTGLFQFIRYIDQMKAQEVDLGEANPLDENADVVRIMTIHKSKGLEFPVCFVSGLARRRNRRDFQGRLLVDDALGIGMDYADPDERITGTTLRKEVIADRIRRDTMGEELRVLYVAMTRAKEKLILTGLVRDYEGMKDAAELRVPEGERCLPVSQILDSGTDFDLVMKGIICAEKSGHTPRIPVRIVDAADLELGQAEEQEHLLLRRSGLDAAAAEAAEKGIRALPDPVLAGELERRFSWQYPHAGLEGLYTKTTVTELKEAAAARAWDEEESEGQSQNGQMLFPEPSIVPYVPDFAASMEPSGSASGSERSDSGLERKSGSGFSAAARGTLIHRCLRLIDYDRFRDPGQVTEAEFLSWRAEETDAGQFLPAEAEMVTPGIILPFLHSPLAARMADAERRGRLFREQPFVMEVPASRIRDSFPEDEPLLIQGIIDAYFEENGSLVIADYKTDHVKYGGILRQRYGIQLTYYAEALEKIYGMSVREKLIYSTSLKREISC